MVGYRFPADSQSVGLHSPGHESELPIEAGGDRGALGHAQAHLGDAGKRRSELDRRLHQASADPATPVARTDIEPPELGLVVALLSPMSAESHDPDQLRDEGTDQGLVGIPYRLTEVPLVEGPVVFRRRGEGGGVLEESLPPEEEVGGKVGEGEPPDYQRSSSSMAARRSWLCGRIASSRSGA